MIKNVSANRFLSFAFEKYCFYNKNRKRRINCRGIAIGGEGGHGGHSSPHFNFQTKEGPRVSVSNIRHIDFYECSEIIRTRNFTILISNYIRRIDHFTLDYMIRSDT